MSHYLSKSDFKVAQSCPTKLFYKKMGYPSTKEENEYLEFIAESGYMIETVAKLLYPTGIEISLHQGTEFAVQKTQEALAKDNVVLFEPTFISNYKLASVDILVKQGNRFELIEVKSKSYDALENQQRLSQDKLTVFRVKNRRRSIAPRWRSYLEDITFQVSTLEEIFPAAEIDPFLMLLDTSKTANIDRLHSLFTLKSISGPDPNSSRVVVEFTGDIEELRRNHFLTKVSVAAEIQELKPIIKDKIEQYVASLKTGVRKIETPISLKCKDCEFNYAENRQNGFRECWGDLADVTPHVFDMYAVGTIDAQRSLVSTLIKNKQVSLYDIPPEKLVKKDGKPGKLNQRQLVQLEYTRLNREWISDEFADILQSFVYPLYFIDFETSALAIPYHAGMRPYEQVAFQWSCHTLREPDAPLEHTEWINIEECFPNFEFAKSLMRNIDLNGTLFMWATHENTVLRDILRQMDERGYHDSTLRQWLKQVVKQARDDTGKFIDMNTLTLEHYFHPLMKGRTSIKVVVDAVWKTNSALRSRFPEYLRIEDGKILNPYRTLSPLNINGQKVAVAEGSAAIRAYQAMVYGKERSDEQTREKWKRLLLQYCKLDTLAMFMIWWHWIQITSP